MRYILIVLICISCHSNHDKSIVYPPDPLDTIKSVPALTGAKPAIFEKAFIKGNIEKVKDFEISFYGVTIGRLKIPTGLIVACDPLNIGEYGRPYTQLFPTGEFPVQLGIANLEGEERIAFSRILFSDAPVVKWELALLKGQAPLPITTDDPPRFGVDGGIAVYLDSTTMKDMDFSKLRNFKAPFYQSTYKHQHNGWRYTMFDYGSNNVAGFTTGNGDGQFASYIGFDATGKVCRLLTEFNIIDWKL